MAIKEQPLPIPIENIFKDLDEQLDKVIEAQNQAMEGVDDNGQSNNIQRSKDSTKDSIEGDTGGTLEGEK